jgi:outer membrane protein OmpA-like peptidoglycan-associated protein
MKRVALVSLMLIATTATAQETITPQGPMPSLRGAWELGIYPMTRNVTTDIGRRNRWGHGFTVLAGKHFTDVLSIEGTMSGGWIPQVNRRTDFSVNFLSPSLSLAFQPGNAAKWSPYILGGVSYDWYDFQSIPQNSDLNEIAFFSGHAGAGLRYRMTHNTALRMEINSEFGNKRPTVGAFMGLSFLRGARRPTPATRTVTVTRTDTLRVASPPRVDTVRVVETRTVRDTVFRSEVLLSLDDVNFDFDQSTLRPEARPLLDRAATELNSNTWASVQVEVVGFTDSRGTDDYNLRLGMRRAKSVTDYLVSRGVAANRIVMLSGGEGSPIADNTTDQGRSQNRRVIIKRGVNRE